MKGRANQSVETTPLNARGNSTTAYAVFASAHYPQIRSPGLTCDAVVAEACFQLKDTPDGRHDRRQEFPHLPSTVASIGRNCPSSHPEDGAAMQAAQQMIRGRR